MLRSLLQLFLFIMLALLLAATVSFPLYKFLQLFTDVEFKKIISQLSTLFGLALIFLYLKINHVLDRDTAGFHDWRNKTAHNLLRGILGGILIMGILGSVLLLLGIHHPDPELDVNIKTITVILIKALVTGLAVGIIEEILYRGALLGGLHARTNLVIAIVVSSLIYSAVHFLKFPEPQPADINWLTGYYVLSGAFHRFSDPVILDAFLSLLAFGVLLAFVRFKTGNIIQCIGLHAGVVFVIKVFNDLFDYTTGNRLEFLVNQHDRILGYLTFTWLVIVCIIYYQCIYKPARPLQDKPAQK